MKIVCISDTHGRQGLLDIPKGDVLIHSGDMTNRGHFMEWGSIFEFFRVQSRKFEYILYICGNHDFNHDYWKDQFEIPDNLYYLEDSEVIIDNIKFYGSPYTPKFYNWAYMENDIDLSRRWNRIPEDTNILITHGPPYSILDKNRHKEMCGSKTLYERVKELSLKGSLKAHIFGHIHEQGGRKKRIEDLTFYNVSSLNIMYEVDRKPRIIII